MLNQKEFINIYVNNIQDTRGFMFYKYNSYYRCSSYHVVITFFELAWNSIHFSHYYIVSIICMKEKKIADKQGRDNLKYGATMGRWNDRPAIWWSNTLHVSRSEYPRDKPFLLTMVSYFKKYTHLYINYLHSV